MVAVAKPIPKTPPARGHGKMRIFILFNHFDIVLLLLLFLFSIQDYDFILAEFYVKGQTSEHGIHRSRRCHGGWAE